MQKNTIHTQIINKLITIEPFTSKDFLEILKNDFENRNKIIFILSEILDSNLFIKINNYYFYKY